MDRKEVEKLADRYMYLSPGQAVRENHISPGCMGSSKSLQITRDDHGIFIYCHRCNEHAYVFSPGFSLALTKNSVTNVRPTTHDSPTNSVRLPQDYTPRVSQFDGEALRYLRDLEFDEDLVKEYSIGYSPSLRRLVYPLFNNNGLSVYQTRRLFHDDPRPKWITYNNTNNPIYAFLEGKRTDIVTITEDINSAIKLTSYTSTYPLLSSNITKSKLGYLMNLFKKYIIWLDNDNNQVLQNVRQLKNKLELLGSTVEIITIHADPKNIPYDNLDMFMDSVIGVIDGTRTTETTN